MKPLNTLILIEYVKPEEKKTSTGVYIPPSVDDRAFGFLAQATVLATNPDCKHVNVGDKVLFNQNAVANVPGQPNQKLVREEDLYAVL